MGPDILWDVASIVYDVGKITVGIVTDNPKLTAEGFVDLGSDSIALLVPGLPAGSTKLARWGGKKAIKEVIDNGTELTIKMRKTRRKKTVANNNQIGKELEESVHMF